MNKLLHHLRACDDLVSLKSALHAVCSGFGVVRSLEVCSARWDGERKALCFLRMNTVEQETLVMHALEIARFSTYLVIVVEFLSEPLPHASAGASCVPVTVQA